MFICICVWIVVLRLVCDVYDGVLMFGYSLCFFFFFKQKTAYEMRISDWSSDVCSSDLATFLNALAGVAPMQRNGRREQPLPKYQNSREIGRASCRERVCQYV